MLMTAARAGHRARVPASHCAPAVASSARAILSSAANAAQAPTGSSFPHLFERLRGAELRMA